MAESSNGRTKKTRFRYDGTSIWAKRTIDGPGVWLTCVRGKEAPTVSETYDVFESIADELWPIEKSEPSNSDETTKTQAAGGADDIESEIAKEVAAMKRPRKERRFKNIQTDTQCLVFITCQPAIDPVKLVLRHLADVETTGVLRTRFLQRLVPVSASFDANIQEIISYGKRFIVPAFQPPEDDPARVYRYKIEIRMRNHNTLSRDDVIKTLASCVPEQHKVDLENAEIFILVQIFKGVCGLSVVREYERYKRFNVVEVAQATMKKNEDPTSDKKL